MSLLKESPMAFRFALNPPALNPRLKRRPETEESLDQHFTAPTLWKEIGNGRLRVEGLSIRSSSQANATNSINRRQR
jgi:hypothetical protein